MLMDEMNEMPIDGNNGGMPPLQPMQPISPAQPMQSATPMTQYQTSPNGMPMVQQVQAPPVKKKDIAGLVKTIVIIALTLALLTFIGLFIWVSLERNDLQENLDEKVDVAVSKATDEQATKLEQEFLEREKYPFKTFSGPADYGQLTFEYPKTWSVYIAAAATTGGDFNAYLNPNQVDAVGEDTINALRVTIRNKSFEDVSQEYQRAMDRKDSNLTMESTTIGNGKITANRYTGTIPNTDLSGYIVTFKIRDKTAIMQTDSVVFTDDFNKLLETVTFND